VASDGRLLELLVKESYLPVVACVAGDESGSIFNVNGDQMAVACAQGYRANRLIFLTDVEGVRDAHGKICTQLAVEEALQLVAAGIATGGMQAKLEAAVTALEHGVAEVLIAPGARPGVVEQLLSGAPVGTRCVPG
jgi:acetylglutamate kinase